ncbi:MAG: tRNA pseudouridine(54/55) synthase Pus10 [Candidatus Hodarchaeales archaeon]
MDFIEEKTLRLLAAISLCDHCAGRQFGNLLTGLSNRERGKALKTFTGMYLAWLRKNKDESILDHSHVKKETDVLVNLASSGYTPANHELTRLGIEVPPEQPCGLCNGIFSNDSFNEIIDSIITLIKEINLEFTTFLVGSLVPGSLAEREEELKALYGLAHGEQLKSELNRETGKSLLEREEFATKNVEFNTPDVIFLVKVEERKVRLKINPLFIYGRYKKIRRGVPQSKWDCKECRGKGCKECDFTGKRYPTSVEEITTDPGIEMTRAKAAKFHGSGREDIDALMLGRGRPFVLELVEPKKRFINLKSLEEKINKSNEVKVYLEGFASRETIRMIKTHDPGITKKYRALVHLEKPIKDISMPLESIQEKLIQNVIHQRTPRRVSHRRADLVRKRRVFDVSFEPIPGDNNKLEMKIHCEGGLYVKEIVNGDEGRTIPSFSELAGVPAQVIELDVIEVEEKIDLSQLKQVKNGRFE